jgi:hypothetical protein
LPGRVEYADETYEVERGVLLGPDADDFGGTGVCKFSSGGEGISQFLLYRGEAGCIGRVSVNA